MLSPTILRNQSIRPKESGKLKSNTKNNGKTVSLLGQGT